VNGVYVTVTLSPGVCAHVVTGVSPLVERYKLSTPSLKPVKFDYGFYCINDE